MKKTISGVQIFGFLFTGILGVLLHFLFDITGGSVLTAPFSAVNESIWEHMKILFFPMFLFALWEENVLKLQQGQFWCIKFWGILRGVLLIPVLYYTGNGALGTLSDWVNIAIFYVTAAITYIFETWLYKKSILHSERKASGRFGLWAMAALFTVWTFFPPHLPIFMDPITGTYGFMPQSF